MRTEYHALQPLHLTHQALLLAVGDQLVKDETRGTVAQYRSGRLLAVTMISRLGVAAMEREGLIARSE